MTPPLSIHGIASVQGYDVMVPKAQAEAVAGAAVVGGDRLLILKDPDHPSLEALGMRWLIADRPLVKPGRFQARGRAAGVWIYENPAALDPPPRRAPLWPLRLGALVSLAGLALAGPDPRKAARHLFGNFRKGAGQLFGHRGAPCPPEKGAL